MDKRKHKKRVRAAAAYCKPSSSCPNCNQPGPHFVPPSFGEDGFFICAATHPTKETPHE